MERSEEILRHWFGEGADRSAYWFGKSEEVDAELRRLFKYDVDRAASGILDDWAATPRGRLALILLLDQFPRNLHRGTPAAFAWDKRALSLALEGLDRGHDRQLAPIERAFFYLPLEHSEDPAHQERAVTLYEALLSEVPADARATFESFLDYARQHRAIIDRFGRFPHRNAILGRETTGEEAAFLEGPGSSF